MWAVTIYLWAGLTTAWALWQLDEIAGDFSRLPGGYEHHSRFDAWVAAIAILLWWAVLPIWVAVHCHDRRF